MHGLFSETVKGVENNANISMGMGLSQAQAETAGDQDTGREHSLVAACHQEKTHWSRTQTEHEWEGVAISTKTGSEKRNGSEEQHQHKGFFLSQELLPTTNTTRS